MDTNNDGIVDDPLAIKSKVGRKSLGLSPEEMKERRAMQRKIRKYNKDLAERNLYVTSLVNLVLLRSAHQHTEEIIADLVRDKRWEISFKPNIAPISGSQGERLRRKKN